MRKVNKIRYARLDDVFCLFWGMNIAIWVSTYFDTLYSIKFQLRVVIHDEPPLDHFFHLNSIFVRLIQISRVWIYLKERYKEECHVRWVTQVRYITEQSALGGRRTGVATMNKSSVSLLHTEFSTNPLHKSLLCPTGDECRQEPATALFPATVSWVRRGIEAHKPCILQVI